MQGRMRRIGAGQQQHGWRRHRTSGLPAGGGGGVEGRGTAGTAGGVGGSGRSRGGVGVVRGGCEGVWLEGKIDDDEPAEVVEGAVRSQRGHQLERVRTRKQPQPVRRRGQHTQQRKILATQLGARPTAHVACNNGNYSSNEKESLELAVKDSTGGSGWAVGEGQPRLRTRAPPMVPLELLFPTTPRRRFVFSWMASLNCDMQSGEGAREKARLKKPF